MNSTYKKALSHLTHPATLMAIFLLFLNDHLLRIFWPSWITGKLGDFAWLYCMPFALAVIMSLIIPRSLSEHTKIVGILSFGMVGIFFILGNSFPGTNRAIVGLLEHLLPLKFQITRDPTDLVALISCGIGWLVWEKFTWNVNDKKIEGYALLTLTAVLTIANSAAPDYGIQCFQIEGDKVIANIPPYHQYISADGGFTWTLENWSLEMCNLSFFEERDVNRTVADPHDENRIFRVSLNEDFEESNDQGKTWKVIPQISFATPAEQVYLKRLKGQNAYYVPGPFDAIRDPRTDNLIIAMGLEGVLVQIPSGEWFLVPVGTYGLEKLTFFKAIYLLSRELFFALLLIMLVFCTIILLKILTWFKGFILVVIWAMWLVIVIFFKPAMIISYAASLLSILTIVLTVMISFATIKSYRYALSSTENLGRSKIRELIILSIPSGVLYFLPYILWAGNIIADYSVSMILGVSLGVITCFIGIWVEIKSVNKPSQI